jgi:Protein of unknown function (DUF5132)
LQNIRQILNAFGPPQYPNKASLEYEEGLGGNIAVGNKARNLSEGQVSEIADEIAVRLRKPVRADGANQPRRTGAYVMGLASGILLALSGPLLRPIMRSAVKSGILVGRYARQVGSGIKEQFEDIMAEAEAELEKEESEKEV